jgi:hypothetical protein
MNFRSTIGFAADAAATGAVSAVKSIMAYVKQLVTNSENMNAAQTIVGNINLLYPDVDQPASAIEIMLMDANGGFITDGQITTVGQIDIYRHRKGTDGAYIQIVNAAAMAGSGLGTASYSYTWPAASWAAGDRAQIHISGIQITKNSKVFTVPRATAYVVLGQNQLLQDGLVSKVGKVQEAVTTEDLNQAASTYDLFTGTTAPVWLDALSIKLPTGAAGGALTSISIQTDDATPGVIISSTLGAVANLTSEAEIVFEGPIRINVGTKIQLTIAGGAHGSEYITTITAQYRAITAGGTLA